MEYLLGIDLGTTNCTVTAVDDYGNLKVIKNALGEIITPSAVFFEDTPNQYTVGQIAKMRASHDPNHQLVTLVKREMGKERDKIRYNKLKRKSNPYVFWGKEFTPAEVSSKILGQLKKDAERELGQEVKKAIITCPAYFGQNEKEATRQAGILAGFDVISIIPEPTAAALSYGLISNKPREKIFVFDLGGGTFDVTILEITNGDKKSISAEKCGGNSKLGGADWDEVIVNYMIDKFYSLKKINLLYENGEEKDSTYGQLTLDAEKAKKELSNPETNSTTITMSYGGASITEEFTREKYANLTNKLNEQCKTYCNNLLTDSGLSWSDIDKVIMVGSMSNCLFLQEMLKQWSGKETNFGLVDAKTCVSTGAAIMAPILCPAASNLPPEPPKTVESTPEDLGLFLGGDVSTVSAQVKEDTFESEIGIGVLPSSIRLSAFNREGQPLAYPMLKKNAQYPCEFVQKFPIRSPNQTTVDVTVLEGEENDPTYCRPIGTSKLPLRGVHQINDLIEVSFSVDRNGILQVYAIDMRTGERIDVEMNRADGGLTEQQVKEKAQEAAQFDVYL